MDFSRTKKTPSTAELLKNGESVLNAGASVGFTDNSYFIGLFKRYYGITPSQYKKGK